MRALRLTLKVTQSALAKTLKVKPSAISQIESGKIRPSTDTMLLLTKLCDVNLHWLITGKGPMWVDPQDSRQKTREKLNQVRDFIHSELDVLARSASRPAGLICWTSRFPERSRPARPWTILTPTWNFSPFAGP